MPPPLGSSAPLVPHLDRGRWHSRPGVAEQALALQGGGLGGGPQQQAPAAPSASPWNGCSHHGTFPTSSRSLVMESQAGRRSEPGKSLVPGLIPDMEPTALTQPMARGLHN